MNKISINQQHLFESDEIIAYICCYKTFIMKKDRFKLLKPFSDYKKGRIFDSFGGLVRGITCDKTNKKVNFDNKEYFKLI